MMRKAQEFILVYQFETLDKLKVYRDREKIYNENTVLDDMKNNKVSF